MGYSPFDKASKHQCRKKKIDRRLSQPRHPHLHSSFFCRKGAISVLPPVMRFTIQKPVVESTWDVCTPSMNNPNGTTGS